MDTFTVSNQVKRLISRYIEDRRTDAQIISGLHDALSVEEKDVLLEQVYRQYVAEVRAHERLQSDTHEILFPPVAPRPGDRSGQAEDAHTLQEIRASLRDLQESRFNSLEEHAVATQRLCRIKLYDGEKSLVGGDCTHDDFERVIGYYYRKQASYNDRISGVKAMDRFLQRVPVAATFREAVDYVNHHGSEVEDALMTDLMEAAGQAELVS